MPYFQQGRAQNETLSSQNGQEKDLKGQYALPDSKQKELSPSQSDFQNPNDQHKSQTSSRHAQSEQEDSPSNSLPQMHISSPSNSDAFSFVQPKSKEARQGEISFKTQTQSSITSDKEQKPSDVTPVGFDCSVSF